MADDQLRLDVIVDDHGAVKVLEDVDKGVAKVTSTAGSSKAMLDELGQKFGVNTVQMTAFTGESEAAGASLTALGITAGVATFAAGAFAVGLRSTIEAATAFHQAADALGDDAAQFSRVADAALSASVNQDRLVDTLDLLHNRIASGKIDGGLRTLGVNLEQLKSANPSAQLLEVAKAVGEIEAPADRARARLLLLGHDSPEAARLLNQSFREAAEGATGMSHDAIEAFNAVGEAWERLKGRVSQAPSQIFSRGFDAFLGMRRAVGTSPEAPPAPPRAPGAELPAGLPEPDLDRAESQMRFLEAQKQEEENWFRIDDVMRNIAEAQALITKSGGDWSDVLDTRVAVAVDNINAKYVQAVMLNTQLTGGAQQERDRLMNKLTATTNPNESEFDRRFLDIDQEHKAKMAAVDQRDRVSAAAAENAILEETNLKVQELQENWEKVTAKTNDAKTRSELLKASYDDLNTAMRPRFGQQLPGGLVMPTAEQVAGGRYFGPVDANGRPDPARMAGATPAPNIINIHANNSINTDGFEELVARVQQGLDERDRNQGGRVTR